MVYDPDELLGRMLSDRDHPWKGRLLARIDRQPFEHERPVLPLTAAELDTLRVMATGQSMRGAAELLGISQAAVGARLNDARRKLRAKNTTHAVAIAIRKGQL